MFKKGQGGRRLIDRAPIYAAIMETLRQPATMETVLQEIQKAVTLPPKHPYEAVQRYVKELKEADRIRMCGMAKAGGGWAPVYRAVTSQQAGRSHDSQ